MYEKHVLVEAERKKCQEKPHYSVVIMANESWAATDSFRLIKSGSREKQILRSWEELKAHYRVGTDAH